VPGTPKPDPETHNKQLYVGTITGTSVDGLDIALLDLTDGIALAGSTTKAFPESLRATLLALGQPGQDDLDKIGEVDAGLGTFTGEAILDFLNALEITPEQVRAIGSHGQTIRHRPDLSHPFTWQIGDPNRIAEITGITTVADFRRRDVAAGGQGAPLVPAFHEALFRTAEESRVLLNVGGISNITWLPADPATSTSGFDTGPGNGLLDAWYAVHNDAPYDLDGAWARTGQVVVPLLDALLADPYLHRAPPKSTGREVFNLPWLQRQADLSPWAAQDVQRTLLEFTAASVITAIEQWAQPTDRLVVCGGGRHNGLLMERLADLAGVPVQALDSETLGFDGDSLEAAAFAWLAARRLENLPGNVAAVTGAAGPRVLGAVYPGSPQSD
jgi:anhydro-N-acetylmuramic acid kinase